MGRENWTGERWEAFIQENEVEGGTTERVPETVSLHCRGCNEALNRDRTPMFQLVWSREGSSSFYCVACARHLPAAMRAEPEQDRADWMQFEPRFQPRHRREAWAR